jgi:hypothetical protein
MPIQYTLSGKEHNSSPKWHLLHVHLPYGKWTCGDGREVLFNRFYEPMWERSPGQAAKRANPSERVPFVEQIWFFKDGNPPWRKKETLAACLAVLRDFGGSWGPIEHYADVRRAGGGAVSDSDRKER